MNTASSHPTPITVTQICRAIDQKPRPGFTMRELHLAAECLRLKALIFDQAVGITAMEERLRAANKRNAQLTAALHRQAAHA